MTNPREILGERVLFLHAHPDDESLSTGGTIAALLAGGAHVRVITATRGERGEVMPGEFAALEGTPALVPVRERELAGALSVLGGPEHVFLGTAPARRSDARERRYTDSGMRWGPHGLAEPADDSGPDSLFVADRQEALEDLLAGVRDFRPASIISYDRRGGYGHPDHVRCHELALAAARVLGVPFYAVVEPRVDPEPGTTQPAITVPLGDLVEVKAAAIAEHRTQVRVTDGRFTLTGGQTHPIPATESLRLMV